MTDYRYTDCTASMASRTIAWHSIVLLKMKERFDHLHPADSIRNRQPWGRVLGLVSPRRKGYAPDNGVTLLRKGVLCHFSNDEGLGGDAPVYRERWFPMSNEVYANGQEVSKSRQPVNQFCAFRTFASRRRWTPATSRRADPISGIPAWRLTPPMAARQSRSWQGGDAEGLVVLRIMGMKRPHPRNVITSKIKGMLFHGLVDGREDRG